MQPGRNNTFGELLQVNQDSFLWVNRQESEKDKDWRDKNASRHIQYLKEVLYALKPDYPSLDVEDLGMYGVDKDSILNDRANHIFREMCSWLRSIGYKEKAILP